MKTILSWFGQQSLRDQSALLLLALALSLYALLLGVVRPLQAAVDQAQQRLFVAEQGLAAVITLAGRLRELQLQAGPDTMTGNLALQVDASAVQAGIVVTSMDPAADGRSITLRLDNVPLAGLMQWLQLLAAENIVAESLVVLPARSGDTLSANLRLVFGR